MTNPLEDRIAVVTGASRGIGYATAKRLAAAGAHIIAVARTVGGLEDLDDEIKQGGGSATLVPADLQDFAAIDRLGAAIHERWGKLDILIGNAGILGSLSPIGHIEPEVWDEVMAVNVTANWRLIRSLDPLLQQSDAGRAVFLSAEVAHNTLAYWGALSVSKAALEAMVKTYASETARTLCANLLNPGPVRTALRAKAMPGEDPQSLPSPDDVGRAMVELCLPTFAGSGDIYDFADGDIHRR